jgi:hypothetical protein
MFHRTGYLVHLLAISSSASRAEQDGSQTSPDCRVAVIFHGYQKVRSWPIVPVSENNSHLEGMSREKKAMSRRTVLEAGARVLIAAGGDPQLTRASVHRIFNAELRLSLVAFC